MYQKIIDLSISCSDKTEGVNVLLHDKFPTYMGQECYAYDLAIKSHTGTYFETTSHLFRNGKDTCNIPLNRLILKGHCAVINHPERAINRNDLEKTAGNIMPGSALIVYTGKDQSKYFTRDATIWMAQKKCHSWAVILNVMIQVLKNRQAFL